MNWIKKIARPLILIVLPAVIIACSVSYKFNGSSINYDKVKTISIADFPIKSEYVYAPLATKFNEDLKDIFIRQTRLQLLKPNQNADLQIDGEIDKVCSPYPIDKKFEAFNFHTIVIDGNNFDEIRAAFKEARETKGQPTAIIAKTVKGKGVSFMENQAGWHGKAPNDEEYKIAMEELEKAGEALCQK